MKPPLVLDILIAHFPYGGNGASASEHPDVRAWELKTVLKMKSDDRVGRILVKDFVDTPITMTRNKAVEVARKEGVHLLLMIDSDQSPLKHDGEPWFVDFWDAAFEEVYGAYSGGEMRCVAAPYCGPPGDGGENVYVFQFGNRGQHGDETKLSLDQYTRSQAAVMSGISEVGAAPTGMMLTDMRCFDLVEPSGRRKRDILSDVAAGEIDIETAERELSSGWFYYEWENCYASSKASTEDVTFTRNLALAGSVELGYNPLRCAWDSWIGHWKPWNVGKPDMYSVDHVANQMKAAVDRNQRTGESVVEMNVKGFPEPNTEPDEDGKSLFGERELFGRTVKTYGHETPIEHLEYLRSVVADKFKKLDRVVCVLEVGSWVGESAVSMHISGKSSVMCIDPFTGNDDDWTGGLAKDVSIRLMFLRNTMWTSQINSRKMTSLEAAKLPFFKDFDVIFIDASHDKEDVTADIEAWWSCLAEGGTMLLHDYNTVQFPGVTRAVDSAFGPQVSEVAKTASGSIARVEKRSVLTESVNTNTVVAN